MPDPQAAFASTTAQPPWRMKPTSTTTPGGSSIAASWTNDCAKMQGFCRPRINPVARLILGQLSVPQIRGDGGELSLQHEAAKFDLPMNRFREQDGGTVCWCRLDRELVAGVIHFGDKELV